MKSIVNHWLSMADPAWMVISMPCMDDFLGAESRGVKVVSPCGSEFEFCISKSGSSNSFSAKSKYLKGEEKVAGDLASEFLGLKRNRWWP